MILNWAVKRILSCHLSYRDADDNYNRNDHRNYRVIRTYSDFWQIGSINIGTLYYGVLAAIYFLRMPDIENAMS